MKNQDILNLFIGLQKVKDLPGVKFAWAVAKNKRILLPEIEALNEAKKPSLEYSKYEKERIELCMKHCKRDSEDKPLYDNSGNFIMHDIKAFEKDLKPLRKIYSAALKEREEQNKEYETLLKQDSQLTGKLAKVKLEDISNSIISEQLDMIYEMIIQEEEQT